MRRHRFALLVPLLLALSAAGCRDESPSEAGAPAPERAGGPTAPAEAPASATAPAEPKIVRVVDDFLAYYAACKEADEAARAAQWDAMLEAKHRAFFEQVIYRKLEGDDRQRHKEYCIRQFWQDVAGRIDGVAKLAHGIDGQIRSTLTAFREQFPAFQPKTDFYVAVTFSFHGKVTDLDGRDIFAIGLENFAPDSPHLPITIAHEMFHLYHGQFFSASGGLYRPLWAEGLATYASAVVVPGHRRSTYLDFPADKMNRCQELLPAMAADLKKHMGQHDAHLQRVYFGAEPNDTQVPPAAGYYVGLLVVESLAKAHPLDELARMEAEKIYPLVAGELDRLSAEP